MAIRTTERPTAKRLVSSGLDDPDGHRLDRYLATGGYEGLRAARAGTSPEQVRAEVKASGRTAVEVADAAGFVVHPGAGAYVVGEETALIESLKQATICPLGPSAVSQVESSVDDGPPYPRAT